MEENCEEIKFFKDKIIDLTAMNNSILQMPTMICFNFCLKEMIDICEVNIETGNKNYFELSRDFLNFLEKDCVLKELDMGMYITLIKKVKFISDNKDKVNSVEMKNYFYQLKLTYGKKYLEKLKSLLLKNLNKTNNYEEFEYLIETFINELLSKGYTYKFLNEVIIEYVYKKTFISTEEFINFLLKSHEDYDIYIPIKNFTKKDSDFIKNSFKDQEIILGKDIVIEDKSPEKDIYYCHIYFKNNDYYKGIIKHIKRLKSIFNFARYYINSDIRFNEERKCIIKAKNKLDINDKSLEEILKYTFFKGSDKIIDISMSTLKKLTRYDEKEEKDENILAKDFYNIIDYSEKDERQLTVEQFINKWIALETLYSKVSNKSGFDSVLAYAPQILAIDFFRKKLNITIKKSHIMYNNLEDFIKACYDNTIDIQIEKIISGYYKKVLYEYKEILLEPKKLLKNLNEIINKIKMDIHRIYIFRNKYVHTGDTKAYYDIPQYYLYQIVALSIDKVMKAVSDLRKTPSEKLNWNVVFTNITNKYNTLFDTISILAEGSKFDKDLTTKVKSYMQSKDKIENILMKILLEKHIYIFEKNQKRKEKTDIRRKITKYSNNKRLYILKEDENEE